MQGSSSSVGPADVAQASTRWLWAARIAALASVLGIVGGGLWLYDPYDVGNAVGYSIVLFPAFLGYIGVMVGLRGRTVKQALALGLGLGSLALLILFLVALLIISLSAPGPLRIEAFEWVVLGCVGTTQAFLVGSTIKAYSTLPCQAGDKVTLWLGLGEAAVLAAIFAFLAITVPSLLRSRIAANQAAAVGSLRTINTAESTYTGEYKAGYSPTLAALGEPVGGSPPSASAAGLIDPVLATGTKSGYTFTYTPGPKDDAGHIKSYTVTARPLNNRTGINSYFIDQTGVIRQTTEDRSATAKDPVIEGQER
jgi:hypothetical protein